MGGKKGYGKPQDASQKHPTDAGDVVETFEVPRKYLGLLIGKAGESIKRFRAMAGEKGIKIHVDQESSEIGGTVRISGWDHPAIVEVKAALTAILFKALSNLENESGGAQSGGKGKGKGMNNQWGNNNNNNNNSFGGSSSSSNTSWSEQLNALVSGGGGNNNNYGKSS